MVAKRKPNRHRRSHNRRGGSMLRGLARLMRTLAAGMLLAAMALCFIFGYDVVTQCGYFRLRHLEVEGIHALRRSEVLDRAGIREDANILSVNLVVARKQLLAHPLVAEVSVRREFPDTIRIEVEEQQPVAVLDLDRRFLVNIHGEIYKEMDAADPSDLPLIRGLSFSDIRLGDQKGSPAFEAVLEILRLGLKNGGILARNHLRAIEVDREIGLTLYTDETVGAVKIGYDQYPRKLAKLEKILAYIHSQERFSRLESVDLINLNRIVVTPAVLEASEEDSREEV